MSVSAVYAGVAVAVAVGCWESALIGRASVYTAWHPTACILSGKRPAFIREPGSQEAVMSDEQAGDLEGLVDVPALARFLDAHIAGPPSEIAVRKHTAGYSNVTLFIDRGGQRLVMRRPPTEIRRAPCRV